MWNLWRVRHGDVTGRSSGELRIENDELRMRSSEFGMRNEEGRAQGMGCRVRLVPKFRFGDALSLEISFLSLTPNAEGGFLKASQNKGVISLGCF